SRSPKASLHRALPELSFNMIPSFFLLLTIFLCHPATALRFYGSCANFAGQGDVSDRLLQAAVDAQKIANNAWRQLVSEEVLADAVDHLVVDLDTRHMSRPENDRIHRLLASYAIGKGRSGFGRTIDGIIERLKAIGRADLDSLPLTIYCGSSNPRQFQKVSVTMPDGTASFKYIGMCCLLLVPAGRALTPLAVHVTNPPTETAVGFPLVRNVSIQSKLLPFEHLYPWIHNVHPKRSHQELLRAVTELKARGARYMIICPAAFGDDLLQNGFPMTDAARTADFVRKNYPETDINWYGLSLIGIMLHELHHALNLISEPLPLTAIINLSETRKSGMADMDRITAGGDVSLDPPLTLRSGQVVRTAYQYYGVTELSFQVDATANNPSPHFHNYELLHGNADTCNLIAMGIWLKGAAWHRGLARSYPGQPLKRALPAPRGLPYDDLQSAGDMQRAWLETDSTSLSQISIGGPRLKSQGMDPSWFGLGTVPMLMPGPKKEMVFDEWSIPRRIRRSVSLEKKVIRIESDEAEDGQLSGKSSAGWIHVGFKAEKGQPKASPSIFLTSISSTMASKLMRESLPDRLKGGLSNGDGDGAFERKHHGKSQSHVVSENNIFLRLFLNLPPGPAMETLPML
ncbi:MAG: hypothetical protein Q9174_002540, partial [Haloplaca sp. 1 TL-2023]